MTKEFLSVSAPDGSPLFMVWDRNNQSFENHNGRERWPSWEVFIADVKQSLAAQAAGFGERHRLDELLREYENAAPAFMRNADNRQNADDKEADAGGRMPYLLLGVLVVLLVGGLWSAALKPALGFMGLIDYKSGTQKRYEKFLAETEGCIERKKVFTDATTTLPVFHLYVCNGDVEKVWRYRNDVVGKTPEGKWVLE